MATLVYGSVLAVFLARLLTASVGLCRLRKSSQLVFDLEWQQSLTSWTAKLLIRRSVELRTSREIDVPMTFGWRSPVILVPSAFLTTCDRVQREAILIHELTHICRGDFLWQILVKLMTAIYWMHPLAWWVRREAEAMRERLCDLLCSQHLGKENYSLALINIADRCRISSRVRLGLAMAQQHSLGKRLDELGSTQAVVSHKDRRATTVVICAAATLVLGGIVIGLLSECIPNAVSVSVPILQSIPQRQRDHAVRHRSPLDAASPTNQSSSVVLVMEGPRSFVTADQLMSISFMKHVGPSPLLPGSGTAQTHPDGVRDSSGTVRPAVSQASGFIRDAGSSASESIEFDQETQDFNAKTAAVVNGDAILNGDVLDRYAGYLRQYRKQLIRTAIDSDCVEGGRPASKDDRVKIAQERYFQVRRSIIEREIPTYVQSLILVQHLWTQLTREEFAEMIGKVDQQFIKEIEKLRKELGVQTTEELEVELRERGTSLANVKKNFALERLSCECVALNCSPAVPINQTEIGEYYQQHKRQRLIEEVRDEIQMELEASRQKERCQSFMQKLFSAAKIETEYPFKAQ